MDIFDTPNNEVKYEEIMLITKKLYSMLVNSYPNLFYVQYKSCI